MNKLKVSLFWFRRDLRLDDNHGLFMALKSGFPVVPVFIFDEDIISKLPEKDPRISFIHDSLRGIHDSLQEFSSSLYCKKGKPIEIWKELLNEFDIQAVYTNEDYEPYAIQRDTEIQQVLAEHGISFHLHKDQVIFEKSEVLSNSNTPYTVFTPYKNKWLETLKSNPFPDFTVDGTPNYAKVQFTFPSMAEIGFKRSEIRVKNYSIDSLDNYEETRNFPAMNQTSNLAPHLRFGTVSIRKIVQATDSNPIFLSELVWREFFMQILYHFPHVVNSNFRSKYDLIEWRNNEADFEKWKTGQTGYPMVDAGMRELNSTGYMHNRVRMITAGFLCKHLLIDWRWGERYFAEKLLDYELSSNNGNWQWSAGTGCDAAPYFRVFNPSEQIKKFDSKMQYIRKWVPEVDSTRYPKPMVEHKMARERAIETYKIGIERSSQEG